MKRLIILLLCSCAGLARIPCHAQTNLSALAEKAQSDFEAQRYSAALTNFSRVIELAPQDADSYCGRGMCRWWLGDYPGAVADYNKAIALKPERGGYYCNRGQAEFSMKRYADALADYDKSIELDPGNSQAYFNRGTLEFLWQTNYAAALSDFAKAIEIHTDPHIEDIYFWRGCARAGLRDFEGAIGDYNKALALNSRNDWSLAGLARTNLDLARSELRKLEKK